jgi:hypothetical protein
MTGTSCEKEPTVKKPFSWLSVRLTLALFVSVFSAVTSGIIASPAHAAVGSASGLSVFVGYAEDKETNNPNPAAFPVPWVGAPNIVFLGGPVVGQTACGKLPECYDAGAIRLDNSGTSDITISNVTVDDHSSLVGGKVFSLWGSFTVPAGKSVILTENPPNNNPNHDNFDTSSYPANNCTPLTVAPTVTITIGGVPTTLVDSGHVLDTGGIDRGSCSPKQNESIQWQPIGASGTGLASLKLTPATTALPVGQQVTETATLQDGSGDALANVPVNFTVASGPNAGKSSNAVTDATGQASFTYADTASGMDIVVASITTVGTLNSNQTTVTWGNSTPTWSGADIGSPTLAGSDAVSNGIWTITAAGADIGGTADQFHFVWQPLVGDGGISADVLTQTNTNSRARAGVMLRHTTDPGSPFYSVVVTPQRGIFVLKRATQGGGVSTVASIGGIAPVYLQVKHSGTTFTAYTSSDGIAWTLVPGSSTTINLTGTLLAGMAVTSHDPVKISTATFGSVTIG